MKCSVVVMTSGHEPFDDRIYYKEVLSLRDAGYNVTLIAPWRKKIKFEVLKFINVPKPKNRLERFFLTTFRILLKAVKEDATIYHFHDPDLIWVGFILKVIFRKKVIYDVHEDYTLQLLNKEWIRFKLLRKALSKLWTFIEVTLARFLDGVIVATPSIGKKFDHYAENTVLVRNFVIYSLFKSHIE